MRRAINENPVVQAALIGVLAIGVGALLLMRMGGSSEPEPDPGAVQTAPAVPPDASAQSAAPAGSADGSVPAAPGANAASGDGEASAPPPVAPSDFVAGPGLPKPVVEAYDDGKAVVLLIVRQRGIDDRKVEAIVKRLEKRRDTAVFVTKAGKTADYSRITSGIDVNRTPALVIVSPKRLTDGPLPAATVSYGFRGPASVEQALENALYKGPKDIPYYPN